jgi:hypothetical protein
MKLSRARIMRSAFQVTLLGLIVYLIFGFTRSSSATVALDGTTYRVTGPHTHENLAVYVIHARTQDPRNFITLEEGLREGVVKVTEKGEGQVNELMIENASEQPLFLQEGDRIQGGKQDRTIYASHLIDARSGPMPVSAFCVEPTRWVAGKGGNAFANPKNPALAPLDVRLAAKIQKDQGQVWAAVAGQKALATSQRLAPNTNSSLTETLDAPQVRELSAKFTAALQDVVDGHPDAVGVAIAVNGQVQEIDFYPNHDLLAKMYKRLLESYALEATLQKDKAGAKEPPSASAVCLFMWEEAHQQEMPVENAMAQATPTLANQEIGNVQIQVNDIPQLENARLVGQRPAFASQLNFNGAGRQQMGFQVQAQQPNRRQDAINAFNQLEIVEGQKAYYCNTKNDGQVVHRQFMARRNAPQPAPRMSGRAGQRANRNVMQMQQAPNDVNQQEQDQRLQTPNQPPVPQGQNP